MTLHFLGCFCVQTFKSNHHAWSEPLHCYQNRRCLVTHLDNTFFRPVSIWWSSFCGEVRLKSFKSNMKPHLFFVPYIILSLVVFNSQCEEQNIIRDQILEWWKEMSVQKPLKCKLNPEFLQRHGSVSIWILFRSH